MNIIYSNNLKKEILLGCTKIEIPSAPYSSILFRNNNQELSIELFGMKGYPQDITDRQSYNQIIFDELESYIISDAKNLIWREFEEEVYNKYMSLNEK